MCSCPLRAYCTSTWHIRCSGFQPVSFDGALIESLADVRSRLASAAAHDSLVGAGESSSATKSDPPAALAHSNRTNASSPQPPAPHLGLTPRRAPPPFVRVSEPLIAARQRACRPIGACGGVRMGRSGAGALDVSVARDHSVLWRWQRHIRGCATAVQWPQVACCSWGWCVGRFVLPLCAHVFGFLQAGRYMVVRCTVRGACCTLYHLSMLHGARCTRPRRLSSRARRRSHLRIGARRPHRRRTPHLLRMSAARSRCRHFAKREPADRPNALLVSPTDARQSLPFPFASAYRRTFASQSHLASCRLSLVPT
jgi:hypothetical protein